MLRERFVSIVDHHSCICIHDQFFVPIALPVYQPFFVNHFLRRTDHSDPVLPSTRVFFCFFLETRFGSLVSHPIRSCKAIES